MEKIKEKPDPTAKMAIDFDHKLPAEREKQASCDPCTLLLCDLFLVNVSKSYCLTDNILFYPFYTLLNHFLV